MVFSGGGFDASVPLLLNIVARGRLLFIRASLMVMGTDVLVIGGGLSGLVTALSLAEELDVVLLVKKDLMESNTRYAQGGMAAVLDPEDSFNLHVEDTLKAGAGLCLQEVVEFVVEKGPGAIATLMDWGVSFDSSDGAPALAREGGHSRRRIARVKDQTGAAVQDSLVDRVRKHPRIRILENHMAVDLISSHRVLPSKQDDEGIQGIYALDLARGEVVTIAASATVLATGGAGKVYLYTSNPDIASGDGVAMAYRAGARISNMEFMQFHPTCLYHPEAKSFLISEALRGEGGVLRTRKGRAFMDGIHPMKELAPRDIVARAIDEVIKVEGDECVFLDMTHLDAVLLRERFPTIYAKCLSLGIDMAKEPIPVVPAAHYMCGGVQVDTRARTSLRGLWAVGEVSHTGLHGANRLASNSMLECATYALSAAEDILAQSKTEKWPAHRKDLPQWSTGFARPLEEGVVISESWDEIRRIMSKYVGILRSNKRLERARRRLEMIRSEVQDDYWDTVLNGDLVELRNLVTVANLIVESALSRRESRGLHFNVDYPHRDDESALRDTMLWRGRRGSVSRDIGNM